MSDPTRKRLLERGPDGKATFTYRRAAETNVAATITRIRRQLKAEAEQVRAANVKPINLKRKS